MIIQGQVGALASTTSLPAGQQTISRFGNMGDQIVSELHGRYYETCYRRAAYVAANQAAATTTVGLATTYTGICLSNPVNSTFNLVINKVGYNFIVAPAAALAVGFMVGYNGSTNVTHTTPITPRSSFVGVGATGVGLVDAAATLPTAPTVSHIFASNITGAITTAADGAGGLVDLEGSVILPPGAYAAIYTSAASGTSGFLGSISWEEVPV